MNICTMIKMRQRKFDEMVLRLMLTHRLFTKHSPRNCKHKYRNTDREQTELLSAAQACGCVICASLSNTYSQNYD